MITSSQQTRQQRTIDLFDRTSRTARYSGASSSTTGGADVFRQAVQDAGRRRSAPAETSKARQDSGTASGSGQKTVTQNAAIGWSIFGGRAGASASKAAATASPAASTKEASATAGTSKTAASGATASKPATQTYATQAAADVAVVQSLKDALDAAGINYSNLDLAAHEDVVTYPGGSYVNRYISVNTNGHVEGLMTDLVGINPNVAVLDIKHMLGMA